MNNFITKTKSASVKSIEFLWKVMKELATRRFFANVLMVGFILFTSIGASVVSPALGFIAAGVTCGIFGFLLGLE
jgi:hypothetical protein